MNGIIYYTDNRLDNNILSVCQAQLLKAAGDLHIVNCSLAPMDFGENIVLEGEVRSYPTMAKQILMALQKSIADNVFFAEHDVLYHPSHFDFTPERPDIYYYNVNNYRWFFGRPTAISYDGLTSLSSLCCNRELAIKHYKLRLHLIEKWGLDKVRSREPRWARKFGYEPGTKKRRSGGVSDEEARLAQPRQSGDYARTEARHDESSLAGKRA